jgi:hypothetical protein
MSAQQAMPGAEDVVGRHKDDFYITPAWVTQALVPHLKRPGTVLDIACGSGAIGRALRQAWRGAVIDGLEFDHARHRAANDVGCYDITFHADWMAEKWWSSRDLIISNPPFRHALRFLELALQRVAPEGAVAFLLPAQFDQETNHDAEGVPRARGRFFDARRLPDGREGYGKYAIEGRVDFKGDGKTDRITYAWFVFGPGHEGVYRRIPTFAPVTSTQLSLLGTP